MGTDPRLSQAGLKKRERNENGVPDGSNSFHNRLYGFRVLQHLQSGPGDKVLKAASKVFLEFVCGW